MRIVCPTCAAAYDVPDARLAPGQAVRCARCGTDWTPMAVEPPAEAVPAPAPPARAPPDPTPDDIPHAGSDGRSMPDPGPAVVPPVFVAPRPAPDTLPPLSTAPAGRGVVTLAWVLSLVVLGALAWAAVAWRVDIMRAWPNSERLFAVLGLPPPR